MKTIGAVLASLAAAATLAVPTAASASGVPYGRPASCSITFLCLYDFTNFNTWLSSFKYDNPSWSAYNAWNDDTSAYNAGSTSWDVKVFAEENYGSGFYCLKPGRGWNNLGNFAGANNNGESNDWQQNACS
jgi:hypothetical protein